MGNKKRYQKLRVHIKYAPAPDVRERLSRAMDILLKAVARDAAASAKKEEPLCQAPAEDALTGGTEVNNSNE